MKAKNYIDKFFYAALIIILICLTCRMLLSSRATDETILVGNETNTTETPNNKSMEVLAVKSGIYSVSIPKSVTLDTTTQTGTYSVKVTGDLDPKTQVYAY